MNFRKLLAFVLVFLLAAQPGGVRFSYAEGTKAAEVKIEEKTEASNELAIELDETELDEYLFDPGSREQKLEEAATVAAEETAKTSKISGALAGAIAAGVAAVAAAVGAAGLMIYNGVSNKDEIAKLWTSEEDSFFSRLGKTVSILFKGVNKAPGEEKTQPTSIDSVDKSFCDDGKLDKEYCDKLEEKLTDKEQESTEQPETESEQKVEEDSNVKEDSSSSNEQSVVAEASSSDASADDQKKQESKNEQEEQNDSKGSEEGSSSTNSSEDQANDNQKTVISETQEEPEVKEQETGEIGQDENPVDNTENNNAQQDTNEGSNSREENPTTISVEEKKEPFVGPLPKKVHDLIKKKNSVLNTLNKLENTCGLDTVGLKSELNALALETLTTDEEFAQAEKKLNSIINRVNALRGKCSDIKSKKDYIEKNWPAAVSILDSSDVSLRNAWDTLNLQQVTEGNFEKLAEDYKNIVGRVKAIINSNNDISELTDKISKAIGDNKNVAWLDKDYYNEKLNNLSNKVKTEESLKEIVHELRLLHIALDKVPTAIELLNKLRGGTIASGACKHNLSLPVSEKIANVVCDKLRTKLLAEIKEIELKVKQNHDMYYFVAYLNLLDKKSKDAFDNGVKLELVANEAEGIINEVDKYGLMRSTYGATFKSIKDYKFFTLKDSTKKMEDFLRELKTNYNKKDIETVNNYISKIDSSPIVEGTCTQRGVFGLKKKSKRTPEDCKKLKDGFVKKKNDLVEKAKLQGSLNGFPEQFKALYKEIEEIKL